MTPRLVLAILDSVYLFALAAWVGGIAFFSFAVAPVIFRVLGAEGGGRFVRALFPRYYAWGVVCGAVALPALVGGAFVFPEFRGPGIAVQAALVIFGTLTMLYCGNTLTPQINAARDTGPTGADRFDRLHRRSVRLNVVALVVGIVLLVLFALRSRPVTAGSFAMRAGRVAVGDAKGYDLGMKQAPGPWLDRA